MTERRQVRSLTDGPDPPVELETSGGGKPPRKKIGVGTVEGEPNKVERASRLIGELDASELRDLKQRIDSFMGWD